MWHELNKMLNFILTAPWFMFGGFAGTFLLTFTTIKLAQSDTIYNWIAGKVEERKAKQAAKIRALMLRDAIEFRAGRQVEDMSEIERKLYFQILTSGFERLQRVYGVNELPTQLVEGKEKNNGE